MYNMLINIILQPLRVEIPKNLISENLIAKIGIRKLVLQNFRNFQEPYLSEFIK